MEEARRERLEEYEVWPEHWDAVCLLMACDTQWISVWTQRGLYWQGLDFDRAASVAQKWIGLQLTPQLFRQLTILATEAKPLRNRHLERD